MFELNFKTFMEQVDTYTNQRNDRYRKIHYEEIEDYIILFLKSQELWEYYTVVPKTKMLEMYTGAGITEPVAVRMFKTNILYDAIPIKTEEVEVENLPEQIIDEDGSTEYNPDIVSKHLNKRVIAIGPRGGRIVAYGSNGKPIYEGSPEDRKRQARREQSRREQEKETTPEEHAKDKYKELNTADKAVIAHNIHLFKTGKDTKGQHYNGQYWHKSRRVLHKKVIQDYSKFAVQALQREGQSKVVFMAGLPASGKTYATQNYFEKVKGSDGKLMRDKEGNNYLVLNADDIKQYLPEYNNGKGACLVHNESSHLNSKLITACTSLGVNIIVDGTLAKLDKAEKQMNKFKEEGYNVKLMEVTVPPKVAIDRAANRYKEEGRFVPYDLIAAYDSKIKNTIGQLKDTADSFVKIDNTGAKPQIIEQRGEQ